MLELIKQMDGYIEFGHSLNNNDIVNYVISNPYNIESLKKKFELIGDEDPSDQLFEDEDIAGLLFFGDFKKATTLLKRGVKMEDTENLDEIIEEIIERDYPGLLYLVLTNLAKDNESDVTDNEDFYINLIKDTIKYNKLNCFRQFIKYMKETDQDYKYLTDKIELPEKFKNNLINGNM